MADVHMQDAEGVVWFGGGKRAVLAGVRRNGSEEK